MVKPIKVHMTVDDTVVEFTAFDWTQVKAYIGSHTNFGEEDLQEFTDKLEEHSAWFDADLDDSLVIAKHWNI